MGRRRRGPQTSWTNRSRRSAILAVDYSLPHTRVLYLHGRIARAPRQKETEGRAGAGYTLGICPSAGRRVRFYRLFRDWCIVRRKKAEVQIPHFVRDDSRCELYSNSENRLTVRGASSSRQIFHEVEAG